VLALSAGVVVELDNALHSPVDLLLDGRLIAQGDVVIVDGKYGLRITDVVESAPSVSAAT
jgi:flagellar motor switch protein FliN